MAIAKFGGPIAILKDRDYMMSKTKGLDKNTIYIFNPMGEIQLKQNYKYTEDIVMFEFIQDELLLILFGSGKYELFDPLTGKI